MRMRGLEGVEDLRMMGMSVVRIAVRREKVVLRWTWVREGVVDGDRREWEEEGGQRGDVWCEDG